MIRRLFIITCLTLPLFSKAQESENAVLKVRKITVDLKANVSGFESGDIDSTQLAFLKTIQVNDTNYKVISCVIYFPSGINGIERRIEQKGSVISQVVRKDLKNVRQRSKIEFQEILVQNAAKENRGLAPVIFIVRKEVEN